LADASDLAVGADAAVRAVVSSGRDARPVGRLLCWKALVRREDETKTRRYLRKRRPDAAGIGPASPRRV